MRPVLGIAGVFLGLCLLVKAPSWFTHNLAEIPAAGAHALQGKAASERLAVLEKLKAEGKISWNRGHSYRMAHCSGPGENCASTGCCKQAGNQCFRKHETWSACRAS